MKCVIQSDREKEQSERECKWAKKKLNYIRFGEFNDVLFDGFRFFSISLYSIVFLLFYFIMPFFCVIFYYIYMLLLLLLFDCNCNLLCLTDAV